MRTFLSPVDVTSADLPPPVRTAVERAVATLFSAHTTGTRHYTPEDDGYVVLVETGDTAETIATVLGYPPDRLPWEGGYRDGEMLVGVLLRNNQFGLTVVVPPDADPTLRQHLLNALADERRTT